MTHRKIDFPSTHVAVPLMCMHGDEHRKSMHATRKKKYYGYFFKIHFICPFKLNCKFTEWETHAHKPCPGFLFVAAERRGQGQVRR